MLSSTGICNLLIVLRLEHWEIHVDYILHQMLGEHSLLITQFLSQGCLTHGETGYQRINKQRDKVLHLLWFNKVPIDSHVGRWHYGATWGALPSHQHNNYLMHYLSQIFGLYTTWDSHVMREIMHMPDALDTL